MRPIDADTLYRKVKTECNPYGKPTIGFEDGQKMMDWIEQAPTVSDWVSVEDRVPESNEIVLVYAYDENDDGYMAMAVRYPCGDWESDDDYFNQMESEVRYWMPLPGPPEEVNKDD